MEMPGGGDPLGIPSGLRLRGSAGAYRLLARLGAGGMGNVYLARSDRGRTVAVKLVRRELAEQEEFRARFRQEVQAARRVGGYWTAPVLDADTEADIPWVATGYVAGPTLQSIVSRDHGAMPERSVRVLAAGLAHALRDIHAAGLIHRDLKPSNVLVTIDGPRVIDFGIARALETLSGAGLTRTGALVGSPGFMAPEQVRGDRVTPACDVFCLGSVLAYAATGALPFGSGGSGVHALMFRIAQEEPDLSGVPESLGDLVRDCLRKDPAARPTPADILERAGAEDTVSGGRSRDPWLPAALVAQLGRHAVRLLDAEDPEVTATRAAPEGGAGHAPGSALSGGGTGPSGAVDAGRADAADPAGAPGGGRGGAPAGGAAGPVGPATDSARSAAGPGAGTAPVPGAEDQRVPGSPVAPRVPVDLTKRPPAVPAAHTVPEVAPEHAAASELPCGAAPPPPASPGGPPAQAASAGPPPPPAAYGCPQQHPQPGYGHGGFGPALGPTRPYGPYSYGGPGSQEPRRRSGRSTAALLVAALVVALGAGGSVYALMRGDATATSGGRGHAHRSAAPATPTPDTPAGSAPAIASPTAPSSAAGAVPDAFLGTWNAAIDNASGHNTRRLVIERGGVGDTVLSLTADGPLGGGAYHCVFRAGLARSPGADGPLDIGPSTVETGRPASACTPGAATELTLLPDGRLRRVNTSGGESLTYTRQN
ncbi:protein kinase [Streptomyces sp. NPDC093261]|uniref:protein kinase domain-containing protein n=1 Tax=Streptomyces sp. NPDC093261 TaxID=3366037 RepID=UPI00380CDFC5